MAKLKITKTNSVSSQIVDQYVSPTLVNGSHVGGTGGNTSQTGSQIQGQTYVEGSSSQQGYIIAQKGAHKFLVEDALGARGICTLVNSPDPASEQMNSLITLASITNANVAAANVSGGATSTYVTWTSTPIGPVATPRVGDYIIGFSNAAAVAQVIAINTASNVTIALTGNVNAQSAVDISNNTYASRITNKFVSDFNKVKFRYHLAAPDATFVQLQSA